MDKNVTRTEVQIDWVSQLAPTHIVITPEPVHQDSENSRHATADTFRSRNLSRCVREVCDE